MDRELKLFWQILPDLNDVTKHLYTGWNLDMLWVCRDYTHQMYKHWNIYKHTEQLWLREYCPRVTFFSLASQSTAWCDQTVNYGALFDGVCLLQRQSHPHWRSVCECVLMCRCITVWYCVSDLLPIRFALWWLSNEHMWMTSLVVFLFFFYCSWFYNIQNSCGCT